MDLAAGLTRSREARYLTNIIVSSVAEDAEGLKVYDKESGSGQEGEAPRHLHPDPVDVPA